ncbi:MAG: ATP-binding protein [Actinomycetota bacterium]
MRVGIWATVFVLVAMVAYALIPGQNHIRTVPFLVIVGVAAAGVAGMAALPLKRLFAAGWGLRLLYLWSALDILLITALVGYTDGAGGEIFFLYAFTTIFFSVSYPRKAQAALLAFTFASYIGVLAVKGWPVGLADLLVRVALLAILGYFARFLSQELRSEMSGRAEALAESRRRADLLASVATAARSVSALDTERVLRTVVDATEGMGFEAADLVVIDEETETSRIVQARGYPNDSPASVQPASAGIAGLVREEKKTVVVGDYATHPRAIPELMRAGFRAVIAAPVWTGGNLTAVLGAGTWARRKITSQEREAFELLAALAGRALENARRFEDERRTVRRLADLDRMKSEFISTASHELRTPLTVIQGMGLTLEQQWGRLPDHVRHELLTRMNENARILHQVIDTLLDFTRIEAGRLKAHRKPVHVGELVDAVVSRLDVLLEDHSVSLQIEPGLVVQGDAVLLDRVLENLLANAAKHTAPGTRVTLSTRAEDGRVVVEVADGGRGIPRHDLRYLGARFFRGGDANTRPTGGTGLGLALVREILRLHGSSLEVWSEVGRGSRFSFRLPLVERHEPARA